MTDYPKTLAACLLSVAVCLLCAVCCTFAPRCKCEPVKPCNCVRHEEPWPAMRPTLATLPRIYNGPCLELPRKCCDPACEGGRPERPAKAKG